VDGARDIMIHNIYRPTGSSTFISNFSQDSNFPDFFFATPDTSDVFSLLHNKLLDTSADLILLGDYNLHHPLWGGERATTDTLAENLISFFNAHFLNLLLPPGTITWSQNRSETTIDLVFASPPLKNALESCRVRKDLHQGSDHLPIHSVFSFVPHYCMFEPRPL
jgi:exonuclease III